MTNGPDFVATDFDFYNCNRYQQCSECVSAKFPCDWCVDGHRCTHDTAENCRNDILVTGVKVRAASTRAIFLTFPFVLPLLYNRYNGKL